MSNKDLNRAFEALYNAPVCTGTTVSTSPVLVISGSATDSAKNRVLRVKLLNGHATQRLAWQIVGAGESAPSFDADFAVTCGVILLAGTAEYINIRSDQDFYVVGSAAGTSYSVSSYETNQ